MLAWVLGSEVGGDERLMGDRLGHHINTYA